MRIALTRYRSTHVNVGIETSESLRALDLLMPCLR